MHFREVTIQRDELTSMAVLVGDWEVAVLLAKHGDEHVQVGELKEFKNREWPEDARSEMQRLGRLYGRTGSGDNAPTFAEQAYGMGATGIKMLDAAMQEARKTAEGPKRKTKDKGTEDLIGAASA